MSYCSKCGEKLVDGAKFCQRCGTPVHEGFYKNSEERLQGYEGKIYKCPNCGEVLKSFVRNCPACGFELRGAKVTSAVREFALKLEAIEARREYEKPKGIFSASQNQINISKTDEQKISLIQNFSIPNTKEDMLEFMILATSNINAKSYDSANSSITRGEKAITNAWNSKIKQVYEKAKRSYGNEADFTEIQELYDKSNFEIKRAKKNGIIKYGLIFIGSPILLIIVSLALGSMSSGAEKRECARMESIYKEAQTALENDEYKKALLNAEGLVYSPNTTNKNTDELKRQWNIKRELLVDEILQEAEKNGINLEYTTPQGDTLSQGTKDGTQLGFDAVKENIDEFNKIMSGEDEKEKEEEVR